MISPEIFTCFDSSIVNDQNQFMECRKFSVMADWTDKYNTE